MGLAFSHCDAAWSYTGFDAFRQRLASAIGIRLDQMKGFGPPEIPWASLPPDAIHPLLDHSDCDGDLAPEVCATVAPRLRELVQHWASPTDYDYDHDNALQLADGMDLAASLGERLRFC